MTETCPHCHQLMPVKAKSASPTANLTETIFMLEKADMGDWDKGFIDSIRRYGIKSEKQRACFEKIRDRYLGKAPEPQDEVPLPEDFDSVPF